MPQKMAESSAKETLADKDFYGLLGVDRTATESQIKTAYRKLALQYHPDRNPGDEEAAEKFKQISIAYAVLCDPNRRRQYDVSGPSGALIDFEGIDVNQVGSLGRVFGALFSKLGVPIPTQISPKALGAAKDICDGKADAVASARELLAGTVVNGRVDKQEPHFYRIRLTEAEVSRGLVILCRSVAMSKFKLVLFDKEGSVRQIEESRKRKQFTSAEMFFVPFDRVNLSELFPLRFFKEMDKDVPVQFHLLDGLEPSNNVRLEPREHVLCVYGDNWFQDVKYQLRMLPAATSPDAVTEILDSEKQLLEKKKVLSQLQPEFVEAKKKFEEAVQKLETETKEIAELLQKREKGYEQFIDASSQPYAFVQRVTENDSVPKGFISSWFGK